MATKGTNQKTRKSNPNLTKNGNQRLGPLNIKQLETMLEKTSRGVAKAKIANRIRILKSRKDFVEAVVAEEVMESDVIAEVAVLVAEETLQATG